MDQGIIQVLKNGYRTTLLREYLHWLIHSSTNMNGTATAQQLPQVRAGVREGHTAHVADAIKIANRAWDTISNDIIVNCCKKSSCVGEGRHEDVGTIGTVQGEVHELLEQRDRNRDTLRSVSNPSDVLQDIMSGTTDDVMQALDLLLFDEVREQDNMHGDEALQLYLASEEEVCDKTVANSGEVQRIVNKIQTTKQHLQEAKQIARNLFESGELPPVQTMPFKNLEWT
eukprot:IDg6518t1